MGRETGVAKAAGVGAPVYLSDVRYYPSGAMLDWRLGNGLYESHGYNRRGQLKDLKLGSGSQASDQWRMENLFGTTNNNGNIISQTMTLPGGAAINTGYKYDQRNRLQMAVDGGNASAAGCASAGGSFCQEFGYDIFGNRKVVADRGNGLVLNVPQSFDEGTNRISETGFGYDTRGNLVLEKGGDRYLFDVANRLVLTCRGLSEAQCTEPTGTPEAGKTVYRYDSEGRRVAKVSSNGTTVFVYDADGQLAAEYGSAAPAVQTIFITTDHLGSTRVVKDAAGQDLWRVDYTPFGMPRSFSSPDTRAGMAAYGPMGFISQQFTGKERDAETGLDYFGARYMSAAQGRFASPDEPFADQDPAHPQSWNLYAYARNNPLLFVDPTGQYTCHSSVSAQECTNFQDSLTEAQKSADALKQKYGASSTQYTDAQRAIDSYGAAGVDNGVVIKVGNTGSAGAQVQVGGVAGPKTKDNPTGQQIDVTFGTGQLGKGGAANAGLSAHEGSHVADGSAWVASGFKDALNPTMYATESRAYRIQANIYEGQGYLYGTFSPTELMWFRGWPQSNVDARIAYWLRIPKAQGGHYGVTPSDKTKEFTPGARLRR